MRRNRVGSRGYDSYRSSKKKDTKPETVFLVIAVILLVLGAVCVGVGVGLPAWVKVAGLSLVSGIFQLCNPDLSNCQSYASSAYSLEYSPGVYFIPLVWGLILGGCTALLIALLCLVGYVCHSRINHCKMAMAIAVGTFVVLAVAALLAGMVIYVEKNTAGTNALDTLYYAFYITAAGILLLIVGAVLFAIHSFFLYKHTAHAALK